MNATAAFQIARATLAEYPDTDAQGIADLLDERGCGAQADHLRIEVDARNGNLTPVQALEALLRKAEADTLNSL